MSRNSVARMRGQHEGWHFTKHHERHFSTVHWVIFFLLFALIILMPGQFGN